MKKPSLIALSFWIGDLVSAASRLKVVKCIEKRTNGVRFPVYFRKEALQMVQFLFNKLNMTADGNGN